MVHPYLLCLMYSGRWLSMSSLHNSWKIRPLYRSGSKPILSLSSPMHPKSFCLVSAPKTLAVEPTRLCECNYIGCLVPFPSICLYYDSVLCISCSYLFTFAEWLLWVINQLSTGPNYRWSTQTSLQPIYVEMTQKVLFLFALKWFNKTNDTFYSWQKGPWQVKWTTCKVFKAFFVYSSSRVCRLFNQHHLLATIGLWAFYFLCTPPWCHATPDQCLSGRYHFKPTDLTK